MHLRFADETCRGFRVAPITLRCVLCSRIAIFSYYRAEQEQGTSRAKPVESLGATLVIIDGRSGTSASCQAPWHALPFKR
jgi:hypothetical protein